MDIVHNNTGEDEPMIDPEEIIELPADEPPEDGVFREVDFRSLTDEEIEEGNRLGREIDPDDDDDNGGVG